MKRIAKWLTQKGFTFKQVTVGTKQGLMVDTNYSGMYPSMKTFDDHNMIRKKVSRYKSLTTEPRGYYTAILIMEV